MITGIGVITPIGVGVGTFWEGLLRGNSGIGRIKKFDPSDFPCQIGAEVEFDPLEHFDRRDARKMDRFSQFAVVAARLAYQDGRLQGAMDPDQSGVVVGTGIGGMESFTKENETLFTQGPKRVSPFFIPMMISNMASGQVAIDLGLKGPISNVATACATGTNAIGDAYRIVQRGDADLMFAGGTEACVLPLALAGFSSMKALSTQNHLGPRACRPFDKERDGFIMGEGAGVLVVESLGHALDRGATIYGEIIGYGMSCDAYHMTSPSPGGEGAVRAMKRAMSEQNLKPSQIGYINAHGTSTPANDLTETQAIKTVLGEHAWNVPVSSIKSMVGHLLGAAGAVETAATVLTLKNQIIPPTINYQTPDPECDLDYVPNEARVHSVEIALKNSFGFGGQNACLALKKYEN